MLFSDSTIISKGLNTTFNFINHNLQNTGK